MESERYLAQRNLEAIFFILKFLVNNLMLRGTTRFTWNLLRVYWNNRRLLNKWRNITQNGEIDCKILLVLAARLNELL